MCRRLYLYRMNCITSRFLHFICSMKNKHLSVRFDSFLSIFSIFSLVIWWHCSLVAVDCGIRQWRMSLERMLFAWKCMTAGWPGGQTIRIQSNSITFVNLLQALYLRTACCHAIIEFHEKFPHIFIARANLSCASMHDVFFTNDVSYLSLYAFNKHVMRSKIT